MIIRRILLIAIIYFATKNNPIINGERVKCGEHIPILNVGDKVDDRDAEIGELPFVADILVTQHGKKNEIITINCAGAIISRTQILTSVQCLSEVPSNTSYLVRVGNISESQGRLFEVDKNGIRKIELDGREPDCGEPEIRQGLAILKLKQKLTYSLGEPEALNRICLKSGDKFFGIEMGHYLNTSGWFFGKQKLKIKTILPTVCPNSAEKLVCGMKQNPDDSFFLQEGAPLFHNNFKNRWALVGIHSGNINPWDMDCKEKKRTSLLAFITFKTGAYNEWLKDELKN